MEKGVRNEGVRGLVRGCNPQTWLCVLSSLNMSEVIHVFYTTVIVNTLLRLVGSCASKQLISHVMWLMFNMSNIEQSTSIAAFKLDI